MTDHNTDMKKVGRNPCLNSPTCLVLSDGYHFLIKVAISQIHIAYYSLFQPMSLHKDELTAAVALSIRPPVLKVSA